MSVRPDPLAVLERHFAPEVLAALEAHVHNVAGATAEAVVVRHDLKPWLTTTEAGELLGCTAAAVRMRHARGRLDGRYHGRRLYIATDSILDLGAYPADDRSPLHTVAPATRKRPGARTRKD